MHVKGTIDRAIQFQNRSLVDLAKEKMKKHYPKKAAEFAIQEDIRFSLATNDVEGYLEASKKFIKKEGKNNPEALEEVAVTIARHFRTNTTAMETAEGYSENAAKKGNQYTYYPHVCTDLILEWETI